MELQLKSIRDRREQFNRQNGRQKRNRIELVEKSPGLPGAIILSTVKIRRMGNMVGSFYILTKMFLYRGFSMCKGVLLPSGPEHPYMSNES